jgi:SAM-dependent methyltransferase
VEPKPKGWSAEYAAWFDEASVVDRYDLRPPYPGETFEVLASLAVDAPRAVLDAGCGLGDLARPLATLVGRVDAVDRSRAMIERGRALDGGESENLNWIHAPIETARLAAPYALVVAGDSVHWFDWEPTMALFADILSPNGVFAVVTREWISDPRLGAQLREVYGRHGANPDFAPLSPVEELERRGLFEPSSERRTASTPWRPTIGEAIGCHHSQNGFVLERMRDPAAFDRELAQVLEGLAPVGDDGRLELDVAATIVWGRPRP